jgi:hypothetical protein
MARVKPVLSIFFLALAIYPVASAAGQNADMLPNAPAPAASGPAPAPNAPVPEHASDPDHFSHSKWFGVVDPGEQIPPLYKRDKMMFWLHEEVTPTSLLPAFVSAGYGQLTGFDPKYGSDSAAFGERLGAAALRQASMRFFSDSLLPTLTRSDPRYFRKAYGGTKERSGYALEQLFFHQRDSGERGFNYSDVFGRLAASGLTAAWYPQPSVRAEVVFRTWGTSLAGAEVNNLFLEFWPDIRDAVFHRNRKSAHALITSADSGSE